MAAIILLLTIAQPAPEGVMRCYKLTVNYATPAEIFPGVKVKNGVESSLIGEWNVVGKIPSTMDEARDPAFLAGVSNATLADYLEKQEGGGIATAQLTFLAVKIRAMKEELSRSLYHMENGNTVVGAEWDYDGESGVAKAKFPFRTHTIFVKLERLPISVLLPKPKPEP